jgi:hypothetical protein
MIAAIAIYVVSDDLALVPHGRPQRPVALAISNQEND